MARQRSTGAAAPTQTEGRMRAVIENVEPAVDGGRYAAKRVAGDRIEVEADCFADGHDVVACVVRWWREGDRAVNEVPMTDLGNDRWRASFTVAEIGRYRYTIVAWVDHFLSWRHDFARRVDPDDIRVAALVGAELIQAASARARGEDRQRLKVWAVQLRKQQAGDPEALREIAMDEELADIAKRYPDRGFATVGPAEFPLVVDRPRAGHSSWYEFFPRSCGADAKTHGTFADALARLEYVAQMGFDVVYLPPIHPIGRERRKGRNNTLAAAADDVGSPWAIGSDEGGHKAVHPDLGTLEDFRTFVARAKELGLEVALDVAYQCAPDHPYVEAHPEWFRQRPDGTVQYAENPPKKYQDIYPFNFESEAWQALWNELASVFTFWIEQGVRIFRVDNPHTKPFPFWEWAIGEIKRAHPDVIFLSEAFTRPKVMHRLAKLGFTQSYTYFTWRNTKQELTEYFTELTQGPGREYFRPNCWPNTPDILPEVLQYGSRPAFMGRVVLAATLASNYGIYGPAYELLEHVPREPGAEEYLNSEKYEIKQWDVGSPESLAGFIARVNAARRENSALQSDRGLVFLPTDNPELIAYAKVDRGAAASTATATEPGAGAAPANAVIVVVNLDVHHVQSGWVTLDLAVLGLDARQPFQVHDRLSGERYLWSGPRNYVELDPTRSPAHIFQIRGAVHSERDFDNQSA
jgi:starch synthase (maltosyl-transferring)